MKYCDKSLLRIVNFQLLKYFTYYFREKKVHVYRSVRTFSRIQFFQTDFWAFYFRQKVHVVVGSLCLDPNWFSSLHRWPLFQVS
jgi:hypothetical protein